MEVLYFMVLALVSIVAVLNWLSLKDHPNFFFNAVLLTGIVLVSVGAYFAFGY